LLLLLLTCCCCCLLLLVAAAAGAGAGAAAAAAAAVADVAAVVSLTFCDEVPMSACLIRLTTGRYTNARSNPEMVVPMPAQYLVVRQAVC
jgi:hypothetical protein